MNDLVPISGAQLVSLIYFVDYLTALSMIAFSHTQHYYHNTWLFLYLTDRFMQVNEGMFLLNGRCGYVLKPPCMHKEKFDPYDHTTWDDVEAIHLTITVSVFLFLLSYFFFFFSVLSDLYLIFNISVTFFDI